jgi:methionyl-tRNA formyltransferase
VQRAILAGDDKTGVTIMQMERGLDTGPMLATLETPVDGKTAGELTAELARSGAELMARVLADLPAFPPQSQPEEGVTYASKIDKAESRIDFRAPARAVERQLRAFNPAPGAWFEYGGERIRIHGAVMTKESGVAGQVLDGALTIACGQGSISPTFVQRAGRGVMTPGELLRGFPIPSGAILP